MSLPNTEELLLLETMRGKVEDILLDEQLHDDMFLVRWLRARDLNVEKAVEMLQDAIQWRMDIRLEERMKTGPKISPFFHENFPVWIDGMDKEGKPVYTCDIGKWDVRKVIKENSCEEFQFYLATTLEKLQLAIYKSAQMYPPKEGMPPITQSRVIFNWEGFPWSQLLSYQTVQNFLKFVTVYEKIFPEILEVAYFINSPSLISTVLKLIKPILPPKTIAKIQIMGTDKEEWKREILCKISEEQIRPQFGGTKQNDFNPFL